MAKARQIVKRRKAVSNIKKITRTMQLVATARFQQAFNRATATKPYTRKISELVGQLSRAGGQIDDPLLRENPAATSDMTLVITSNRGLCGSYNANVLNATMAHLKAADARATELHCVGKKGINYFKFLGRPLAAAITSIDDRPRFEQVEPLAEQMMKAYREGRFGRVFVSYMRFYSAGRQRPEVLQLLPMTSIGETTGSGTPVAGRTVEVQYDFSPAPDKLLAALVPQTVKVRLFQCFMDAAVSEQVMRMVAMKSATDAASDMIKDLSRRYNRARQTQITLELLDIVGGAEALK
ncbi:MAG: ATP synthase F1 subunit gamma [Phycisphaerae bacterium]|nr:ATP synthase F1 subunit gamma [Phycisphaerae bacterium]NUQ46019.1 ATP synthase F1 subunit gamma [Phycisphaerae bacterium]